MLFEKRNLFAAGFFNIIPNEPVHFFLAWRNGERSFVNEELL